MKHILFGNLNQNMEAVIKNIPYEVEYIISNEYIMPEFKGYNVYSIIKLLEEKSPLYIFICDVDNYQELADQLIKLGLMEGRDFSSAIDWIFNNWKDREYFHALFEIRIRQMSRYISEDCKDIWDLGCGEMQLKKYIDKEIDYKGVDYCDRGENTLICDFNAGQFPEGKVGTIFCSGCIEYIENLDTFIENISLACQKEFIVSYCPVEYKMNIWERRKQGWKNHLSIYQFINLICRNSFDLEYSCKSVGSNMIFKFKKRNIVKYVQKNKLTYLEEDALNELVEIVKRCNKLKGAYIEAGCALGGSGICIGAFKNKSFPLYIYDVFGMIPAPGMNDGQDVLDRYEVIKNGKSLGIGNDTYYGYVEDLLGTVKKNFIGALNTEDLNQAKIFFIKGLFEETLKCEEPIAFAHIDCDWYDSVKICLERIVPNLVKYGVIVIDDYYHWSGCRKAVDEYFAGAEDKYIFENKSRLHIIKK